jgi:signal transduction histidine kinase
MFKKETGLKIPPLVILFGILAVFIVVSGFLYYQIFRSYYLDEVAARLEAVAYVKAEQLAGYLEDRVTEGELLSSNTAFGQIAGSVAAEPDNEAANKELDLWLVDLVIRGHYDSAVMVNEDGEILYSLFLNQPESIIASNSNQLNKAFSSAHVVTRDLYPNPNNQRPTISLLVPLKGSTVGQNLVLLLQIDVITELYPKTDLWVGGGESGTAFLMLSQPDGWVLYGSSLITDPESISEFLIDEASIDTLSYTTTDQNNLVGVTLNDSEVIGFNQEITGSDMSVLVTQDKIEAMAPITHMLWLTFVFMSALLIVVAAAVFGTLMETIKIRRKDVEINNVNAELERFTYTVTHDLKSPVVTIKTFLNFMLQDIKNNAPIGQVEKNATYIRNATDRMSRLLDELLRMSLLGHQDKPASTVSYKSLIDDVVTAVAGRLVEKDVQLQVSEDDILLKGDRSRFVELWQNLVENAIKYTQNQGPSKIHIGFEYRGKDIEFFVKDNGIGIAPEHHVEIFGIFAKLDSDSDGTGLGLAVVQKIVNIYSGKIWVESAGKDTGSTFRFTLPDAVKGHKKASGIRY